MLVIAYISDVYVFLVRVHVGVCLYVLISYLITYIARNYMHELTFIVMQGWCGIEVACVSRNTNVMGSSPPMSYFNVNQHWIDINLNFAWKCKVYTGILEILPSQLNKGTHGDYKQLLSVVMTTKLFSEYTWVSCIGGVGGQNWNVLNFSTVF